MEDRLLVVKALLECYPYIEDIKDALTRSSEGLVRSGFYAIFPNEQMRIYEQLIRNGARKGLLDRMKSQLDAAFLKNTSPALSILKERFIYHTPMQEIMMRYGVCLRTCYRYLQKGVSELAAALEESGWGKKKILTECGGESLFSMMLNKVIEDEDAEQFFSEPSATRVPERRHGKKINNHRNRLHHGNSGGRAHCYV